MPVPEAVADPPQPTARRPTWNVGTLTYTRTGLAVLFAFLFLGDFGWQMRERSALPMVQLLLKKFQASDFLTGLFLITLPNLTNLLIGPVVSFASDRYRSRWGRRIPFLLWTTPMVTLAMLGLGFSPEVGSILHRILGRNPAAVHQSVLVVIGLCWTLFEIGALTANAVFGALVNDVVPRVMLGRFFGVFRAVSLTAGIVFNYRIIGHAEEHLRVIFSVIGAFYGIAMIFMCVRVKEGAYPPPPVATDGARPSVMTAIKSYWDDCFTDTYYLLAFAFFALGNLAFVPVNTFLIYAAKSYGMSMEVYGKYFVVMFVSSFVLAYPLGWLADRYHSLRVGIAALAGYALATILCFLLVTGVATFGVALLAHGILSGCFYTGTAAICQMLFPPLRYAQFAAAAGMVNSILQIILGPLLGWFLDLTGSQYRYTFLVGCIISLATIAVGLALLRRRRLTDGI